MMNKVTACSKSGDDKFGKRTKRAGFTAKCFVSMFALFGASSVGLAQTTTDAAMVGFAREAQLDNGAFPPSEPCTRCVFPSEKTVESTGYFDMDIPVLNLTDQQERGPRSARRDEAPTVQHTARPDATAAMVAPKVSTESTPGVPYAPRVVRPAGSTPARRVAIEFAYAAARLTPGLEHTISAYLAKTGIGPRIYVEAIITPMPNHVANLTLANQRVAAVYNALRKFGVPADAIRTRFSQQPATESVKTVAGRNKSQILIGHGPSF